MSNRQERKKSKERRWQDKPRDPVIDQMLGAEVIPKFCGQPWGYLLLGIKGSTVGGLLKNRTGHFVVIGF